ncbi:MAG: hypothetical protein GWM98_13155 [Nitrospinaceae bacterium]|nr:hypothetical protein [Nitrospinaceae bacterium]NIU96899.1 hypothetical protein [Nitrospinaceae bacterium]NIX34889.1 hypothetical protein [Nitrospinaceae bacterium]NIY15766.1 hypothetical protein [Nitrospinaceae bacterium]
MNRPFLFFMFGAAAALAGWPVPAEAGMPSILLSEIAEIRLKNISFFLALLLLVTFAVYRLWNFFRKDFPNLPVLSFKKSLGLVLLWGLAFHLVLGMITGTRELMTPKAWEKEGLTYKIKKSIEKDSDGGDILMASLRREKLNTLRNALWAYAQKHNGRFPNDWNTRDIPQEYWQVFNGSDLRFQYVRGMTADTGSLPLAYEPGVFGEQRYVLLSNGNIERLHIDMIQGLLQQKQS